MERAYVDILKEQSVEQWRSLVTSSGLDIDLQLHIFLLWWFWRSLRRYCLRRYLAGKEKCHNRKSLEELHLDLGSRVMGRKKQVPMARLYITHPSIFLSHAIDGAPSANHPLFRIPESQDPRCSSIPSYQT